MELIGEALVPAPLPLSGSFTSCILATFLMRAGGGLWELLHPFLSEVLLGQNCGV